MLPLLGFATDGVGEPHIRKDRVLVGLLLLMAVAQCNGKRSSQPGTARQEVLAFSSEDQAGILAAALADLFSNPACAEGMDFVRPARFTTVKVVRGVLPKTFLPSLPGLRVLVLDSRQDALNSLDGSMVFWVKRMERVGEDVRVFLGFRTVPGVLPAPGRAMSFHVIYRAKRQGGVWRVEFVAIKRS